MAGREDRSGYNPVKLLPCQPDWLREHTRNASGSLRGRHHTADQRLICRRQVEAGMTVAQQRCAKHNKGEMLGTEPIQPSLNQRKTPKQVEKHNRIVAQNILVF